MAQVVFVGDGPNSDQIWPGETPNQTTLAETFMNKVKLQVFKIRCLKQMEQTNYNHKQNDTYCQLSMVRCFTSKPPIFPTLLGSSSSDRRNLLSFPVAGEEVKDYADWRLGRAGYLSCVWTLEGMTPLGYIASAACGPGRGSCSVKFDDERVLHRHLKFESQVMPPTAHTTGRERRRYQRLRDVCWRYALYSIMS
ncbi:hypothetical protein BRADI_1g28926v3 [Brachypodium distachyon]|uniref:Uncharacterized protein n=1 Tax=Brachypodium distachyon TaxID=15368 RepID=A0A2K2DLR8_BRADI|nr:hypothetical protein BRADI_1g28926v3 [Brachypodium distachyon]